MTGRSYSQFCALAQALDRIGDRWTLLIVRDLLAGPARFRDLAESLPGVATNLLTQRLRALEEDGIVVQELLPPPASVKVYRLTAEGLALEPVLAAIGAWGMRFMLEAPYSDPGNVRPMVYPLRMTLGPRVRPDDALRVTLEIAEQEVACEIDGGALRVALGPARAEEARLRCDYRPLFEFIGGLRSLGEQVRRGLAKIDGDAAKIDALDRIRRRDPSAA